LTSVGGRRQGLVQSGQTTSLRRTPSCSRVALRCQWQQRGPAARRRPERRRWAAWHQEVRARIPLAGASPVRPHRAPPAEVAGCTKRRCAAPLTHRGALPTDTLEDRRRTESRRLCHHFPDSNPLVTASFRALTSAGQKKLVICLFLRLGAAPPATTRVVPPPPSRCALLLTSAP
jgi:hypothetical protein